MNKWIRSNIGGFTPGGDPIWECGHCHKDQHVYGIETQDTFHHRCKNCGSINYYPWEKNNENA